MKKLTKKHIGKVNRKALRKALIILVVIFAVIIGISSVLSSLNSPYDRTDNTYTNVKIEEGSSTTDIAAALKKAKLIKSERNYKILSKVWRYDGKYKAGVYSVSPSMSPSDIAQIIVKGNSNASSFTIPEGMTIYQIADTLSEQGFVDKDKFINELQNGDFSKFSFLDGAQTGKNHLEGYLFPNTYQVGVDADEEQIITTMLDQFDTVFTDKYKKRAKKLGYSENQIIIIASIIEREAKVDKDRPKVASVIYNRLDKGMALQMCSTVQYALGKQKQSLSVADTKIDSPYNTYINEGLPPGPICCPGEASIKAALYPDDTDYLYFVVSEKLDGTHNFSSSYEQFQKDTKAYENALEKADADKES